MINWRNCLQVASGENAGGCLCYQCSTPKWLTLISKVEFSFVEMLWTRFSNLTRDVVVITTAQLHSKKFELWFKIEQRFKSCSRRVRDSWWWGFLTMVPAGNKAKRLSPVNHTKKQFIIIIIIFIITQRSLWATL